MKQRRTTVGIDPGLRGAVAVFAPDGGLDIWDLAKCYATTGNFRSLSATLFSELLDSMIPDTAGEVEIFCEESLIVHGNGIKTSRVIFDARGVLRSVCELRGLSVAYISPVSWKRHFGLLRMDKAASIRKAIELLPKYADFFRKNYRGRVIDLDGRTEAALIGLYGRSQE